MKESGAKINKEYHKSTISFSRTELRSLLQNLVTNAIKFRSQDRELLINICTYEEDEFVVLEVSDNGIGFDISKKNKIFLMFQRLHAHTAGTGMGLYMVKRIVENAGGRVDVESEK